MNTSPPSPRIDRRSRWSVLAFAFLALLPLARAFVHPGIPFTTEDITQLKTHVANGDAPWAGAYQALAGDGRSKLTYNGNPRAAVSRAPDVNRAQFANDMTAIHNLTWMWLFTENDAYAQRATDLLDAWAVTNTYYGGDEGCLELGDYVEKLVTAADILKAMYPGWTTANTEHVRAWFANVLWPVGDVPNPVRGANQGAIQLKISISIAAFLDDETRWNQALSNFRGDAGGGLANSLPNGQVGDTGRDDGHWIGQIQALAWSAEVAWKQGVDLFSEYDNRLLAASELWAAWSLGQTLPPLIPHGGAYEFHNPGSYAGGISPYVRRSYTYNIIENAYVRRLGLAAPHTVALRAAAGDDTNSFVFLKTADTSTATPPAPIVHPSSAPATNLTHRDVGDVGLAGSATYDAATTTWTLKGAGADIPVPPLTEVDAFNYTFQPITGDAVIIARLTSIENTDAGAKAGIMIRESLAADARYVGLFIAPGGGATATWRGATGWNKTNVSWNNPPGGYQGHGGPAAPWWLKIERLGTRVHVLHSPDGVHWTGIQSVEIALPDSAYLGLCVTSHNASALTTSTFDQVAITNPAPAGAPVITSATAAEATVGAAFSYRIAASASPTSYAAAGLPAGLSVDADTGVISGTPTTPGTSLVTVSATNASGTGSALCVLTVLADTAPPPPADVTATPVDVYDVRIAWTASPHATSYTVKRSTTAGGPYTTIITGVSGTSFVDVTASSGDNYYVVTALAGPAESGPSAEALIALPSGIPEQPTVTNGDGQVTLTWPAADGAMSYNVKRATTSGGPYATIASGLTETSYADTAVTNGTYYFYVVSSVSTAESANSAEEFGLPGAATYTWSPTAASGAWSDATNWVEGVVPTSPALLVFGASTTTALTNDLPGGLEVARFTFAEGAGAYTIDGNPVTLGTEVTNNSTELQSIQLSMTVNRPVNSNANAGRIMLGSHATGIAISGPGGFVTRGPQATAFIGANTFSGGIISYGTSSGVLDGSRNLSFSGVGTPSAGPFGTGRVTLHQSVLSDTLPLAAPRTRNVLHNEIYVVEGTKNVLFTGGAGALDFHGKLLGGGQLEGIGWNSAWDFYSGSPHFFGDNSEFTGTFVTITRSSWQRLQFRSATSGSANARFRIGGNISATQSINGATVHFGELSGGGSLNGLGTSGLIVGELNTDSTFSGVLYGSLALTKKGTGAFTLTLVNSYSGPTVVESGKLWVNTPGSITSAVTVNDGATFGGNGSSSSTITVAAGGTLAPGLDGSGTFITAGNVTLNTGASFAVALNSSAGTAAGLKAPQVLLNGATLHLTDVAPGSLPPGAAFTLIENTGSAAVSGTFANLPEASPITVNGNVYRLSYGGGTGNDVVLYDEASAPALITSAATASGKLGTPFSYQITALGSPTSFGATGLPAGLTIDPATGVISGTPDDIGTFSVTLTATNSNGTGTGTLMLTIGAINPPAAPTGLTATAASNHQIDLTWPATRHTTGYAVKRATTSGGPYTTVATASTHSYQDQGLSNASTYYYVVAALNDVGASADSPEASATPVRNAFLDTFSSADVGAVAVAGSTSYDASGVVSILGSGADIWGNADGFRYFHRTFTGDGAIVARVLGIQNTHPAAKAGVMIRESLAPGSRHAMANLTAVNGVEFIRRQTTNSGTSAASTGGVSAPRWVRVVRAGNSFSAFHAADGLTWTAIGGPISIGMASSVTVGLAVNSHNNPVLALGRFDHVNIATAAPAITSSATAAGTYGAPFHYATEVANTAYLYTAAGLPPGLSLDADTGVITGTPTAAGAYTVTLGAVNAMGASSATLTIAIAKAEAVVTLDKLVQPYDGTAREVTVATTPAGLDVDLLYGDGPTPPVYPGSYDVVATIDDPNYAGSAAATLRVATTATVRHGFTLDGMLDGSAQVLTAESVTLNGESTLSSDLLLPGTPTVQLNGSPTLAGVEDGPGAATPTTHSVTLNGAAVARYLVRRIDAVAMPTVAAPPAPTGTRSVTLSSPGQGIGNPTTLRNLTLNGGAGAVVVPPGTYGSFSANGGSSLVFGVAGATEPAVYHLQALTLNGASTLQLAGPVTLTLASGVTITAVAGEAAHPEWLTLRLAADGVTLNTGAALHGNVVAPTGTVTIGSAASLHGSVNADRLQIALDGLLDDPEL